MGRGEPKVFLGTREVLTETKLSYFLMKWLFCLMKWNTKFTPTSTATPISVLGSQQALQPILQLETVTLRLENPVDPGLRTSGKYLAVY